MVWQDKAYVMHHRQDEVPIEKHPSLMLKLGHSSRRQLGNGIHFVTRSFENAATRTSWRANGSHGADVGGVCR